MFRHFILSFLAIVIVFALYSAEAKDDEEFQQDQNYAMQPFVAGLYLVPSTFIPNFWTEKIAINPAIFQHLLSHAPRVPAINFEQTPLFGQIINEIFSQRPVLDEIKILSEKILKAYTLKRQVTSQIYFNPLYEQDITRNTLFIFLKIINTPDPYRNTGNLWKLETFARVFSKIWDDLDGTNEDVELNLALRHIIGYTANLNPLLNFKKEFKSHYPNLAIWIKGCTQHIPNLSKKPKYTIFTFSFMIALTAKFRAYIAPQIIYDGIRAGGELSIETSCRLGPEKALKPNSRSIQFPDRIELLKNKTLKSFRGRRNSLEFDDNGKMITPNTLKRSSLLKRSKQKSWTSSEEDSDDEITADDLPFLLPQTLASISSEQLAKNNFNDDFPDWDNLVDTEYD